MHKYLRRYLPFTCFKCPENSRLPKKSTNNRIDKKNSGQNHQSNTANTRVINYKNLVIKNVYDKILALNPHYIKNVFILKFETLQVTYLENKKK